MLPPTYVGCGTPPKIIKYFFDTSNFWWCTAGRVPCSHDAVTLHVAHDRARGCCLSYECISERHERKHKVWALNDQH